MDEYWTVYDSPSDLPFVCNTPYNIGNNNIVCQKINRLTGHTHTHTKQQNKPQSHEHRASNGATTLNRTPIGRRFDGAAVVDASRGLDLGDLAPAGTVRPGADRRAVGTPKKPNVNSISIVLLVLVHIHIYEIDGHRRSLKK